MLQRMLDLEGLHTVEYQDVVTGEMLAKNAEAFFDFRRLRRQRELDQHPHLPTGPVQRINPLPSKFHPEPTHGLLRSG